MIVDPQWFAIFVCICLCRCVFNVLMLLENIVIRIVSNISNKQYASCKDPAVVSIIIAIVAVAIIADSFEIRWGMIPAWMRMRMSLIQFLIS